MQTHTLTFIQDLAVIMLIAGLATVLCHRLKQPIVLGYIIAGIIISPHTPPFVLITDETTISTLAELGVIFLMFSLGLEFNLHHLSKVGSAAFIAAFLEIILMIALGYGIGCLFGWSQIDSIFLGAILSISSTTIIVKALNELGMKKEKFSQLIFGILIIEDIFAILILALLSSAALTGSLQINDIIVTATKLLSFLVISLLLGILLIPKILAYVAKFNNDEMLLIVVLGMCFGFSLLVLKLDYSVALGAFIIGAIIAEAKELQIIENLINPIRDMFSAIFFVSVGLLFNPAIVNEYIWPILFITFAVVVGKVLSCSLGILITGRDGKTAVRVGMGLAQIGEFSFIIASLGVTLRVTSEFLYSIAVCISIITTLLTPYLIKHSDSLTRFLANMMPTKITKSYKMYSTWMSKINASEDQIIIKKAIKKCIMQIIINLFIVIAIFLMASFIAKSDFGDLLIQITNHYIQKTMIWTIALFISLPFIIAMYRKIRMLSVMLIETNMRQRNSDPNVENIKSIASEVISILAIIAIMVLVSLLSVSILPPIELLLLVLVSVIILMIFLFPWFIKLHAKLQIHLLDSLKNNKDEKK